MARGSTPETYWKFDSLKGAKNYHEWATAIEVLSWSERTRDLIEGTEKRPAHPPTTPSEEEAEVVSFDEEKALPDIGPEQAEWDRKNKDAWGMLFIKIDYSIWHHFSHTKLASEVWRLAKEKFSLEDAITIDHELAALIQSDASKFESIQEYHDHITKHNNRLKKMGKIVPDWILAAIFRRGLTRKQARYITYLIEEPFRSQKELTVDEMTWALVRQE